jgi:hypothetical protein
VYIPVFNLAAIEELPKTHFAEICCENTAHVDPTSVYTAKYVECLCMLFLPGGVLRISLSLLSLILSGIFMRYGSQDYGC